MWGRGIRGCQCQRSEWGFDADSTPAYANTYNRTDADTDDSANSNADDRSYTNTNSMWPYLYCNPDHRELSDSCSGVSYFR